MQPADFAEQFPRTLAVYEQGLVGGQHIGMQLYVSRVGKVVADLGLGDARPGVDMAADTLMSWFSAGKPVTAVAVMQLCEQGSIALDDPVAKYIPEFAQRGKEGVTVFHLLTHTGGFRFAAMNYDETSWPDMIERICALKLERDWAPGQRAGYHPLTSWIVLGEIVQRQSGVKFADYVRDEIFVPLALYDSWIGMPVERYRGYGHRIGWMQVTERPGRPAHFYSTEQGATNAAPGGGAIGPIRQLGRLYEMLLAGGELDGVRILPADAVAKMTSRQRAGMVDETFRATIDWGLGFLLDSKRYGVSDLPYGYGQFSSYQTFGHSGSQSSAAFADPAHQLVVAVVYNGMPGEVAHQLRMTATLEAIYTDLGLA